MNQDQSHRPQCVIKLSLLSKFSGTYPAYRIMQNGIQDPFSSTGSNVTRIATHVKEQLYYFLAYTCTHNPANMHTICSPVLWKWGLM